jgi:hypothetical protein
MSSANRVERRREPRIKRRIPLKIKLDDYDLIGQTQNISCIGASCITDKRIPPFSLISIILLLPLKINNRHSVCNVRCQGVVVRARKIPKNSKKYNIAIYFSRLRRSDKAKLLQYVQQYL